MGGGDGGWGKGEFGEEGMGEVGDAQIQKSVCLSKYAICIDDSGRKMNDPNAESDRVKMPIPARNTDLKRTCFGQE